MKPQSKGRKKQSTSPVLRVSGNNLQMVQFQDYDDGQGGRVLVINLAQATLADANDVTILTGQIMVRVETIMPPASLAIVSRLLTPFTGYFVIVVQGTYQITGNFAEVAADTVLTTDIQPVYNLTAKSKLQLHPIQTKLGRGK